MDPVENRSKADEARAAAERADRIKLDKAQADTPAGRNAFAAKLGTGQPAAASRLPLAKNQDAAKLTAGLPTDQPASTDPNSQARSTAQAQMQTSPAKPEQEGINTRPPAASDEGGSSSSEESVVSSEDHSTELGLPPQLPTPPPGPQAVRSRSGRVNVTAQQLQQIVQFAAIGQNAEGQSQFHMGLVGDVLGGMNLTLIALGNRRLKIKLAGGDRDAQPDAEQLNALVELLGAQGIEVVEVERG